LLGANPGTAAPRFFIFREKNMATGTLLNQDHPHKEDIDRAMGIVADILPKISVGEGLALFLGLMAHVHYHTHGQAAFDDFNNLLVKFTETYPIIHEDATEKDRLRLMALSAKIDKAWRAARPAIHARAIQILLWSLVVNGFEAFYDKECVDAWVKAMTDWARRWDSSSQVN
jgi:hypothetical protein